MKWGAPCYTLDGKLVVGVAGFKAHFALWFHQGALLEDRKGVLVNAQAGKTRALRQWRFTDAGEIKPRIITSYIREAIANQEAGREIKATRNKPLEIPPELSAALGKRKKLQAAFDALGKTRQREFAEHVGSAKREATRASRLAKILPMIEAGVGLNDKYRT